MWIKILFLLILCIIASLIWYYLVPHFSGKNCEFVFLGEFSDKAQCEKKYDRYQNINIPKKHITKKVRFIETPDFIYYDPEESPDSLKV